MKIALYILSLCFLLLGGYCAAYGIVPNDGNHAAKRIGKTQLIKIPSTNRLPVIAGNALPLQSNESIVSIESEDDDDSGFRRKIVLLATCILIVAYASFLTYLHKYFKNRLYSYKQLFTVGSYTYLLQGALRI